MITNGGTMRGFSDQLLGSLKAHEGFRAEPYTDTVGKFTIGYGTNLHALRVTEDEAEYWLRRRLEENERRLRQIPEFRQLDEVRQDVLRECAYQLGVTGLTRFRRMWVALRKEPPDHGRASMEMLDSRVGREQAPARWSVLARRMKTGTWGD